MAIVQISRITQRKGLSENVPQLAGAEFGWAIDTRRLYIGNGALQDGAPVIGNTEVLTEFSDVLALAGSYTYKDSAVGYTVQTGPTLNQPVTRSVQAKLDDFASVRDFGATGDGVTDDTLAINRALYQLYCREVNPAVRRSLFFPAGVYKVSETIIIPTYARLYGEGSASSIILLDVSSDFSTLNSYVSRYGDSLQQTGANIGANGAIPPKNITITNMAFQTMQSTDVFLVDQAVYCSFDDVVFQGPLTAEDLADVLTRDDISGVMYNSSSGLICSQINFDNCKFTGTTWGISTNEEISGSSVTNSQFNLLYQGIWLGGNSPINGGATGFTALHNIFDNIYEQGVYFQNVSLNATGYNIFYDVGNHFDGSDNPFTAVITFTEDNNASISDLFERDDAANALESRIQIENTQSVVVNSSGITLGAVIQLPGQSQELLNNTTTTLMAQVDTTVVKAVEFNYIFIRDTLVRKGVVNVVASNADDSSLTLAVDEEYSENGPVGVTITVYESGDYINIAYSSTNTGITGQIHHSLNYLA